MDYKLLLDTAVMAGEILLESGAETWRVEDTMLRMLRMSGLKTADVLALTTGFMVTLDDPSMDSMTVMRSVESRATDLNRIHAVNQLSRDFCEGTIDLDTLFHRVRDIYRAKPEIKKNLLAMIATTAGFAIMFGCGLQEALLAAIVGLLSALVVHFCRKMKMHSFLQNSLSCITLAVAISAAVRVLPWTFKENLLIISCIMPFVPGAAITNAVFDVLHGDYLSGVARAAEAFVIAAAVALGIGIGLSLF